MDGIINVLKPAGMTSFDVIACLRRIYGQKRIGHGGTLDPLAAGVLPVFLGRAARLIEFAPIHMKTYEAEFLMGVETDTEDVSGHIVTQGTTIADFAVWEKAAKAFCGRILQVPSLYSAKLVNGRRAYDLAREGKEFTLPAKEIEIYALTIREVAPPYLRLSVTCSAGTYVRSLGRDLGRAAGCPLTMSFLLRSAMGPFTVQTAKILEEIQENPDGALLPLTPDFIDLPLFSLSRKAADDFLLGKRLSVEAAENEMVQVWCGKDFLGTGRITAGVLHPKKVWN